MYIGLTEVREVLELFEIGRFGLEDVQASLRLDFVGLDVGRIEAVGSEVLSHFMRVGSVIIAGTGEMSVIRLAIANEEHT